MRTVLVTIFLAAVTPLAMGDVGSRPNIVLIMCDDMGFSDIGCYGGQYAELEPIGSRGHAVYPVLQ